MNLIWARQYGDALDQLGGRIAVSSGANAVYLVGGSGNLCCDGNPPPLRPVAIVYDTLGNFKSYQIIDSQGGWALDVAVDWRGSGYVVSRWTQMTPVRIELNGTLTWVASMPAGIGDYGGIAVFDRRVFVATDRNNRLLIYNADSGERIF